MTDGGSDGGNRRADGVGSGRGDIQESFQDLIAEESPVKALVEETLKADDG